MQFRGYKTSQKIEQIVRRARQSIDLQRHFEGGDFFSILLQPSGFLAQIYMGLRPMLV